MPLGMQWCQLYVVLSASCQLLPPLKTDLRKPLLCGHIEAEDPSKHDFSQFNTWIELLQATAESISVDPTEVNAKPRQVQVELQLLRQAQVEDFLDEYKLLQVGKAIPCQSWLIQLAPEYDPVTELLRVGGRLHQSEDLKPDVINPVVLDPKNPIIRLIIADMDSVLNLPGLQSVFAQLRRKYWAWASGSQKKSSKHVSNVGGGRALPQFLLWPTCLLLNSAYISLPLGQPVWIVLAPSPSK